MVNIKLEKGQVSTRNFHIGQNGFMYYFFFSRLDDGWESGPHETPVSS